MSSIAKHALSLATRLLATGAGNLTTRVTTATGGRVRLILTMRTTLSNANLNADGVNPANDNDRANGIGVR